jgi:hypothetical protein
MKARTRKLLFSLGQVLMRFGLWIPAIVVLMRYDALDGTNRKAKLRLHYSFLMVRHSQRAKDLYAKLLRTDLDRSAEANFALAVIAYRFERYHLAALIDRRTARQTHPPVPIAVAKIMARFDEAIISGDIYTIVSTMVDRLALQPNEDLTLVAAGERYLGLFGLWLEQARKHIDGRIFGLAMDQTAFTAMTSALDGGVIDLSSFFVFDEQNKIDDRCRQVLWILRVLFLRELVSRGHRVLSIDLDAVAMADLTPMLKALPEADIVAQQDYSIPLDVARELGFVLCCGFMVFFPTPATNGFLDRYAQRTIYELDDQASVNHLIQAAGVTDRVTTAESMSFRASGVRWVCPAKSLVSRDISTGKVIRHFHQGQSVDELRVMLGLEKQ